ncbi:hypothetical protein Thena_0039 [Thermodesulfobium narugense DSM 14796]|uniref:Metallo-beta-lactamase domain-containing protein n=1 Tax=Thermodesulfobium narugense DSM 14796 TaxID=747365 RepID=M1E4N5_9BACT|nr:MBL fold metallo-hydrolase [Thermodesulfobium narugense]AEE13691.1 hypothetical protein Thena_0039 [Thermodesulfobium narugense DSM 14796]
MEEKFTIETITGKTSYIPGSVNCGFYETCMIDTPWEMHNHKKINPQYLLLTHGHADHFRMAFLFRGKGAKIVAPKEECIFVENPEINVRATFSWAIPPDAMISSLMKGVPCKVDIYSENFFYPGITVVPLPGHSISQVGYLTSDKIFFTGDALYTKELWNTFPLPYSIDPLLVKNSLERIANIDFDYLVPGHGKILSKKEAIEEIGYHIERINEIDNLILRLLESPCSTEEIISDVLSSLEINNSLAQYWIAVTVIKSHLSALTRINKVDFFLENARVYWERVK